MSWHHPDLYFFLFAALLAFIYECIQQFYTQKRGFFPENRNEPEPFPPMAFSDDGKPGQGDGPEYLKKTNPPRAQFRATQNGD